MFGSAYTHLYSGSTARSVFLTICSCLNGTRIMSLSLDPPTALLGYVEILWSCNHVNCLLCHTPIDILPISISSSLPHPPPACLLKWTKLGLWTYQFCTTTKFPVSVSKIIHLGSVLLSVCRSDSYAILLQCSRMTIKDKKNIPGLRLTVLYDIWNVSFQMWAVQYVSDVEMTPKHAKPYSRGISMGKYLCKFTWKDWCYTVNPYYV